MFGAEVALVINLTAAEGDEAVLVSARKGCVFMSDRCTIESLDSADTYC